MAINLGVKALLVWVNSFKLSDCELAVDDLQDGTVLLKVVYMLKKHPGPCFSSSTEDRHQFIADFLDKDCRFSVTKGTKVSWDNIRDGINLTVEIAKVLLLLVYHDMMNDRLTLNMLDCDVEQEIANLTSNFVMESQGCVHLSNEVDAYLTRRYLPVSREIFEQTATTSSSSVSTVSSISDDESPIFCRTQKVKFVDMHTVASSSVSKSPLQEIMNTPKFQLRKMQRQMIKERDYRDCLERELASKLAIIAQRESYINQLKYHLEKLKEEHNDHEQATRDQLNELETKNNTLQMRLDEILKKNKDLKSLSSLMEHKVDELTEENGVLSSQMRAVSLQLATFEVEVVQLTESQATAQEEWRSKTSHLQSELNKATAEKDLLYEEIQILQGKISILEDELSRAANEEIGENMGPIMERENFEAEISGLRNELATTSGHLKRAEVEIEAKTQQLAEDQQEIHDLRLQLEQAEEQKIEQMTRLQEHITACEQEIKKLKEIKKAKEDLLSQTEERVKELETKLLAACSVLGDKDQQINSLKEEVDLLIDESKKHKENVQAKEEMLATLLLQKSNEQDILHNQIHMLTVQMEELSSSLKQAEQHIQVKQDLLAKTQQENVQQKEVLQQQIVTHQEESRKLNAEMKVKNDQLVKLRSDSAEHIEFLEQEVKYLKDHLESLKDSFKKAEDQVQAQQVMLTNQEQESGHQIKLLQEQLSTSEKRVRSLEEEIQTKEKQMETLTNQSSEQAELLHQEIQKLKKQAECLDISLKSAEENLQSKESLFVEQQLQSKQCIEVLQAQMVASQDEVTRLNAEICTKEELLVQLKTQNSSHSESLQQEIESLNKQIQSMHNILEITKHHVQAKEDLIVKQKQESTLQLEAFKRESAVLEEVVNQLKDEIRTKEQEVNMLKAESCNNLEVLQNEIQTLRDQVQSLSEEMKSKEDHLTQQQQENAHQREALQSLEEKAKQVEILQQRIYSHKEEFEKLKQSNDEKESLFLKAEEKLQEEVETISLKLMAKEQLLFEAKRESAEQIDRLQQQLHSVNSELTQLKEEQAIERENAASRKLGSVLQLELDSLKTENDKLLKEREKSEAIRRELQEQLSAKSEAAEHYKAQMEKAVSHYNSKKQLLQKSQEKMAQLQCSLEVKDCELTTITMNNKRLQLDLDQAQTSVKKLSTMVASLEAQLAFADQNLRAQNKIKSNEDRTTELHYLKLPNANTDTRVLEKRSISSDSLDQSSLEDSLNTRRKLSAPDESSTPLVRSSERLAAKRQGLQAESLETLYFTPINTRQISRTNTEQQMELNSAYKNPTSSVKRRRTTQVINITMTKKTPHCSEGDETFCSLASARSQPNLTSGDSARPVSMELCDTPARTGAASDQLIGLPGFRRKTLNSQTTSTICVGAENEPDGAPEDWMRIAELQARNKACLPHLKSSYPVETETGRSSTFMFTDEELRTGDPSETIRRASMMPCQLRDSLTSHRHSLMMEQTHTLSLMSGQLPSRTVSSNQPKGTKRPSATLSVHSASPEKKVKASCFPRPLTPKNKNDNGGPLTAERRESFMFVIENTPKSNNYIKRGLNKARSVRKKSPGKSLKKSPAQTTARKCQENLPPASGKAGRAAKSPGLMSRTRKMMRKING